MSETGLTTERISLDRLQVEAPCVACGEMAGTAYRGTPLDTVCAVEVGFYAAAVKRGLLPPELLAGLVRQLPQGGRSEGPEVRRLP